MKKQSQNKFINLIETMSAPATIVDITANKIIASNSEMLRSYGLKFSKTLKIAFDCHSIDKNIPSYFIMNNTKSSVSFTISEYELADFEFLFLDDKVGLLFEISSNYNFKLDSLSQITSNVLNKENSLNFNFSYIYNFAFNSWQYSDKETLVKLKLIDHVESIKNFTWRNIVYKKDLLEYDNGLIDLQQNKKSRSLNYRVQTLEQKLIRVLDYCGIIEFEEKWPVIAGSVVFTHTIKPPKIKSKSKTKETKQKTILFIEDMTLILNGVTTWLESWGYNVLTADNGEKGWQLFLKNYKEIDCVIQDYILPDKGGDSLLMDMLKKSKKMPVVVISGNSDENNVTHLKELGAYCFLEKPFEIEHLKQVLDGVFEI